MINKNTAYKQSNDGLKTDIIKLKMKITHNKGNGNKRNTENKAIKIVKTEKTILDSNLDPKTSHFYLQKTDNSMNYEHRGRKECRVNILQTPTTYGMTEVL